MDKEKNREHLHQILDLILDINGMQETIPEKTKNHPTVTAYFHGHVGYVDINIYPSGWNPYTDAFKTSSSLCNENTLLDVIAFLKAWKVRLNV